MSRTTASAKLVGTVLYTDTSAHVTFCYERAGNVLGLLLMRWQVKRQKPRRISWEWGMRIRGVPQGWTPGTADTEDGHVWPQQPACFFVFARFLFFYIRLVFVLVWRWNIILLCYLRTHLYLQLFYYVNFVFLNIILLTNKYINST